MRRRDAAHGRGVGYPVTMFEYLVQEQKKRGSVGTTLLELCVVLAVTATLFAIALPLVHDVADRASARGAVQDAGSLFAMARRAAITRRALVAVHIDTSARTVSVRSGPLLLAATNLGVRYGVRLTASRDSMSYDPRGLGFGVANLTLVASRGKAAETLFVSRLGRTRH
jgi:type II secretory pathway pseudopilin PulG